MNARIINSSDSLYRKYLQLYCNNLQFIASNRFMCIFNDVLLLEIQQTVEIDETDFIDVIQFNHFYMALYNITCLIHRETELKSMYNAIKI